MPELPEVETTRRGLAPHATGRRLDRLVIRDHRLRWPVDPGVAGRVAGRDVTALERRGKYLIFRLSGGAALLLHLGMSGHVRVVALNTPVVAHDHVDFVLDSGVALRFNDPRRFGSLHEAGASPDEHPLLERLGPEPLSDAFDGGHLWQISRGRRVAVKNLIMDSRVVVGVGNIYAAEALHRSGIHPARPAGRVSQRRYAQLAMDIKAVLGEAIEAGGTTLRDFARSDGLPGYFQQTLAVYGRGGQACHQCGRALKSTRLGQRATVYCPGCQR